MKLRRLVRKRCRGVLSPVAAALALVRPGTDSRREATAGRPCWSAGVAAIFLVAASITAACAATPAVSNDSPVDEHAHGKELYERKCGVCHELFAPEEYDCDTWTDNVGRYAARAHLAPRDRPAVIAYLHAGASDAR